MTSAQRATLRSLATKLNPIFSIGKGGISENLLSDLNDALEKYEMIKITVLKNADVNAKDMLPIVCDNLGAEPITAIGNKIVIYRKSSRNDIEHIKF